MTIIPTISESTYKIKLSTHSSNMQGCLIKEYTFDCSREKNLVEIQFTNFYTHSITAKACYKGLVSVKYDFELQFLEFQRTNME